MADLAAMAGCLHPAMGRQLQLRRSRPAGEPGLVAIAGCVSRHQACVGNRHRRSPRV